MTADLPSGFMPAGTIPEPTHDQCAKHAAISLPDGRTGYAGWYPQMGGYVSACIVVPNDRDGCFDAYVWHDGEFPFRDGDHRWDDRGPARIHHCSAEQFIGFGQWVGELP